MTGGEKEVGERRQKIGIYYTYYVPGMVQSALNILSHLIFKTTYHTILLEATEAYSDH